MLNAFNFIFHKPFNELSGCFFNKKIIGLEKKRDHKKKKRKKK